MTLSNPSVTTGAIATAIATAPAVTWREKLGGSSVTRSLTNATTGYECSGTVPGIGDYFTLNLSDGTGILLDSTSPATNLLTLTGNAVADETVTIDTTVYTWKDTLTAAYQVKIGATASDSIDNLIAAITADTGEGTLYGTGTVAHPTCTALVGTGDTMNCDSLASSSAANSIATTETMTNGSWATATLTGGVSQWVLNGADGNDIEGAALTSITAFHLIQVDITAGEANVSIDGQQFGTFGPGGGTQIRDLAGDLTFVGTDLVISATALDTDFTVTVFGANA